MSGGSARRARRVLVTGANGMLGSHVIDLLCEEGAHVVAIDRVPPERGYMSTAPPDRVTYAIVDILDRAAMRPHVADVDEIVHLAGRLWRAEGDAPDEMLATNVVATHNLFQDACELGTARMVFASSGSVYGDSASSADGEAVPFRESDVPAARSFYALSKHVSELYAEAFAASHGLSWAALRIGVMYGPRLRMGLTSRFLRSVLDDVDRGGVPSVDGNPNAALDWVSVTDAAQCVVRALRARSVRGPLNVSTGRATRLDDVLTTLLRLYGAEPAITWTMPPDERIPRARCYDPGRTGSALGFAPSADLAPGLRAFIDWRRELGSARARGSAGEP
jgi:nucleoside-diphosphate-sugar epimerase